MKPQIRFSSLAVAASVGASVLATATSCGSGVQAASSPTTSTEAAASAPTTSTEAVPADALARALATVSGEYGEVSDFSNLAASTMSEWCKIEPGYTSDDADCAADDSPVYAVIVFGTFKVAGPMQSNGEEAQSSPFDQGRIVFDPAGDLLNVRLWSSSSEAVSDLTQAARTSSFGAAFDDR